MIIFEDLLDDDSEYEEDIYLDIPEDTEESEEED